MQRNMIWALIIFTELQIKLVTSSLLGALS